MPCLRSTTFLFLIATLVVLGAEAPSALAADVSVRLREGTDAYFCARGATQDFPFLFRIRQFRYCGWSPLPHRTFTYEVATDDEQLGVELIRNALLTIAKGTDLAILRDQRPEILFMVSKTQLSLGSVRALLAKRQIIFSAGAETILFGEERRFFDASRRQATCNIRTVRSERIRKFVVVEIDAQRMHAVETIACVKHAVFALFDIDSPGRQPFGFPKRD